MQFCKLEFAQNIWSYRQKAVLLHRVFHGIRFKVK